MKAINLPSPNLNNTATIVAVGAASGALAGLAGLAAYGLLAGKGSAAAWAMTQNAVNSAGRSGLGWLGLLITGSAGALGGGVSGLGVARKTVDQQVEKAGQQFEAETEALRQQVASLEARLATGQTPAAPVAAADGASLESIRGIGPRFATLLQEAGIRNLQDLAQASPDQLQQALGSVAGGQMAKLESWISQAETLVSQPPHD